MIENIRFFCKGFIEMGATMGLIVLVVVKLLSFEVSPRSSRRRRR